jgi:hypothetical protein
METILATPTENFFSIVFGACYAKAYGRVEFGKKRFPVLKQGGKYMFKKLAFMKIVGKEKYPSLYLLLNDLSETIELDETCFEEEYDAIE